MTPETHEAVKQTVTQVEFSPFLQICFGVSILVATVAFLVWFCIRYESAMSGFMSRHLGASWRTSLWGSVNNVAISIAGASTALIAAYANPTLDPTWWYVIKLIPQHALPYILGVAGTVKLVSGFLLSRATKSVEVSGGPVKQDDSGKVAIPAPPTPPPVPNAA